MTDQPTDPDAPAGAAAESAAGSTAGAVRWTTPPSDGGERLDGRSAALVSADRLLTGRRGRTGGGLETIGIQSGGLSEAESARARGIC